MPQYKVIRNVRWVCNIARDVQRPYRANGNRIEGYDDRRKDRSGWSVWAVQRMVVVVGRGRGQVLLGEGGTGNNAM